MEESVVVEDCRDASSSDTFERDLLVRMQHCISERKKHIPFSRAVSGIDWEQVAFDEHSADECHERWQDIQSRLRVQRTLAELLDDAQASRWDSLRLRKALKVKRSAEGGPVKPLSSYLLFCKKLRPKLAKKRPDLSAAQMMTLLSQRYAAASPEKKEVYRAQAAASRAEYKTAMEAFEANHPELGIDKPPKRPLWACEFYAQKHPDVPRAEASAAYRALSLQDKSRYIRKAQRAQQRYVRAVEAFKELHPGWEVPSTATRIMRKDLDKAEGLVRRPRSAYHLFVKDMSAKADVPAQQRLRHCAELWRSVDADTKQHYQVLADEEKAAYQRYIDSLPVEERPQPAKRAKQVKKKRAKRVKRLTGKQLFMKEKMPTDYDALSEEEWRRILSRKYAKLSPQDKDVYNQRASTMRAEEVAENSSDAAEDAAAGGDNASTTTTLAVSNGFSLRRPESDDASLGSDADLKPPPSVHLGTLELSESEAEKSVVEPQQETPTWQTGAGATPKREAADAEPVKAVSTLDRLAHEDLSPAYDSLDESWGTEDGTVTPAPHGKKRTKSSDAAPSDDHKEAEEGSQEESSPKKRKHEKHVSKEEQKEEEAPSSAYEWFVENFRLKSLDGLPPKKIQKKANKAWNSLSDVELRRVERRFAKATASR